MARRTKTKARKKTTPRLTIPHRRFRTRIANAGHAIDGVDGRSAIARRFREVAAQIVADIGGPDMTSEAQLQLARSAGGLVILREILDRRLASGQRVDIGDYTRLANSLCRTLTAVGIKRVPRDITPTLDQYARRIEGEAA